MTLATVSAITLPKAAVTRQGERLSGAGTKTAAAPACQTSVAVINRSTGILGTVPLTPGTASPKSVPAPADLPVPAPATAVAEFRSDQGLLHVFERVSVAANDAWYVVRRGQDQDKGTITPWVAGKPGTSGWGRMTALVEAHSPVGDPAAPRTAYALDRGGALYRYAQNPTTDALGRRVLLKAPLLATLTLHSWSKERDILLGTTPAGALVAVVVSGPTRTAAGTVALRSRTWQNFDRLVFADCSRLLAVDSATNRAALYDVGSLRAARTTIAFVGWSTGPWSEWVVGPFRAT